MRTSKRTPGGTSSTVLAWLLLLSGWCGPAHAQRSVVVYTSVDQVHAEPVLDAFRRASGVRVDAVFDAEAVKTVGLATRIASERESPRADVFWSGEVLQTIRLRTQGLLEPYASPAARDIPAALRDPGHHWTGFACRARVILVNRKRLPRERWPRSLDDLITPEWKAGEIGIANPLFGTTGMHVAALRATRGPDAMRRWLRALRERALVTDGNAMVRDLVVSGHLAAGLTDTDDAAAAVARGADVEVVVPDQGPGQSGTLVIPNTVALVRGGPHPAEARALVDFLLSREGEAQLARSGSNQMPVRADVPRPPGVPALETIKSLAVSYEAAAAAWSDAMADVRELLLR